MTATSPLHRGRDAFDRHVWGEAHAALASADRERPLEPDDLQRLSIAAYLTGQPAEQTNALLARTHHAYLSRGDTPHAVQAAFWLAFALQHAGDRAQAAGWMARAQRLLDDRQSDCVERGYLLVPQAHLKIANEPEVAAA